MTASIEYKEPSPTRARKASICEYADKLREKVGLKNGFDLSEVVNRNGGKLSYIDFMDDDQTDAIVVNPEDKFIIRLSSHTSALRDNFTIAHELGHFVLHWPIVKQKNPGCGMKATRKVDGSNDDLRRCEWEANWFASAFLMPERHFRDAYKKKNASEVFGVTQSAVQVRARALGINDEGR